MPDVIITPSSGIIEFKPSSTTVNKIEASGNTFNLVNTANASGTIFNIEATNGSLFSVVDNLDGTLMSVNNNAGLPVLEVFSDDKIVGGRFGQNDFVVSSSGNVGVGLANPSTKLEVSGTIKATTFSGAGTNLTGTASSLTVGSLYDANQAISVGVGTAQYEIAQRTNYISIVSLYGVDWAENSLYSETSTTATYADQLNYPRNLWGQSFDGTASVSGNISGAGNITMGTQSNKATLTYTTNTARTYTIPDAGANADFVLSAGNQSVGGVKTFTNQIINTTANSTTTGGGQIYLNGLNGNRIDFSTAGVAAPTFTTRSAGTKIVLFPALNATNVDYAIGMESSTQWYSVPNNTTAQFKWYGGTTNIATLTGAGVFSVAGSTSQINVDNLRLDGSIISTTNPNGSLSINPNGNGSVFFGDSGLIEFRPSSNRFIMSDSGPEIICDFNDSSCLFRKSSGGGATVALFIDRSSSTSSVGINTSTPSEALDVDGTIKAKSLNIGSSNTLNVANTYGSIIGGYQSKASMYGEIAHAAGGFANVHGTAQHTILVARGITLSGAFTVTIASPAVFTRNGHSLSVGDTVKLSTTGSLPTGLNTTTTYYVISSGLTGSTFQLSTTLNGTAINTGGTQSGTHTLVPSTSLTLNGAIGLTTPQLMVIPARSTWSYTIKISAYNAQNNQGAAYHAFGGLRRNVTNVLELETTNGFTYLENSFNTTPGLVTINADTTNSALDIRVTGIVNQSTRWVAVVDIAQVSFGTP